LITSGCKTTPVYDECIITFEEEKFLEDVIQCTPGDKKCVKFYLDFYLVADCIKPDESFYTLSASKLDGYYAYSANHRSNILKWGKSMCKGD